MNLWQYIPLKHPQSTKTFINNFFSPDFNLACVDTSSVSDCVQICFVVLPDSLITQQHQVLVCYAFQSVCLEFFWWTHETEEVDVGFLTLVVWFFFFSFPFALFLLLSGHNRLILKNQGVLTILSICVINVYKVASVSKSFTFFCRTDFSGREIQGGDCFILDTCSCLQCGYKRLETMNSQFEGSAFVVSVYSAPIVEGVFLQSSIVYLLIFYFGTLKSFSNEKQINIFNLY